MKIEDNHLFCKITEECLEMIFVVRDDGFILYLNQKAKAELNYSEEDSFLQIMTVFPDSFSMVEKQVVYHHNSGKEEVAYRKNKTCFPVEMKVYTLKLHNEKVLIVYAYNQSMLKECWQQMRAERDKINNYMGKKDIMIANITHELRTPVNGIKGIASVLLDSDMNSKQVENIHIIQNCCNNMSHIIDQILDFAKLSANKIQLESQTFSLRKFIENTLRIHYQTINEKGLKLQVKIAEDIPEYLIGDELRLGQILNNLLSNAVKFTDEGKISLEVIFTYQDSQEIELLFVITDTGIGLTKEEQDKLFMNFSQVDGSISRKYGGTGLGLSISKNLIEKMNGRIEVRSEKGKGSIFTFSVRLNAKKTDHMQTKEPNITQLLTIEIKDRVVMLLQKLSIAMELEYWEKAERFVGDMKQMLKNTVPEIKKQSFLIEMSVRKEDYIKAKEQIHQLCTLLEVTNYEA